MKLSLVSSSPQLIAAHTLEDGARITADVCVIGSGAGGGVAAATLAQAGLDVLVVEESAYLDARNFTAREAEMLPALYQEGMQRATADLSIGILQGRAVGGGTVVNWTTSLRAPEDVLALWAERHAISGVSHADLLPHYEAVERRLAVRDVIPAEVNRPNQLLLDGCAKLGWSSLLLKRNVHRCAQLGSCGLGCTTNAKRSMLVTTLPDVLERGGRILHGCRIERLEQNGGTVVAASGSVLGPDGRTPTGKRVVIQAVKYVLAGGAINGPALLLRSGITLDGLVGARTFLHPATATLSVYPEPVNAWEGAPQSVASFAFARRENAIGCVFEATPWHPSLAASLLRGFGAEHEHEMERISSVAPHIGITFDGLRDDVGGRVTLRPSGAPMLDYRIVPEQWEALSFATQRLAELNLAMGAEYVLTSHDPPLRVRSLDGVPAIATQRWEPCAVGVFSAHQLGGCAMSDNPRLGVVRPKDFRVYGVSNLHVADGSLFPTGLGLNPQLTIFAVARLAATRILEGSS
jgi:choline dehydrogenase-like flavoprotein